MSLIGSSLISASPALSSCTECKGLDGFVTPSEISEVMYIMVGKNPKKYKEKAVEVQKQRGGIITKTYPAFINGQKCPEIDSEKWAIDYSHKRSGKAIHKGIDIPQKKGTPVLAVSDGTVIGKFMNNENRKGIEVTLRHNPGETGLPYFTYTQYTHLLEMSPLQIGAKVKMGDEIAKISNTGKMGKKIRRDALHFSVLYSQSPKWTNDGDIVAPAESYWMDPVVFFSNSGPYESEAVKSLPKTKKAIPTPFITTSGQLVPADTKKIWPFACK